MSDAEQKADALECLIEAERLNVVLDVLQSAAKESILHLGRDGLQTKLVDPGNVFMFDVSLRTDAFADTGTGSFPIGVNLERVQDYLDKADAGELVSLSYDTQTRKLRIQYGGVNATVACIDPDAIRNEPTLPEVEQPNSVTVPYVDLKDALDVADITSDHFSIVGRPDEREVAITAEGDTDDIEYVFDAETVIAANVDAAAESKFSTDFFLGTKPPGLLKQMPKTEVTLSFGQEQPIFIDFEIADGGGDVRGALAPRIDTS